MLFYHNLFKFEQLIGRITWKQYTLQADVSGERSII